MDSFEDIFSKHTFSQHMTEIEQNEINKLRQERNVISNEIQSLQNKINAIQDKIDEYFFNDYKVKDWIGKLIKYMPSFNDSVYYIYVKDFFRLKSGFTVEGSIIGLLEDGNISFDSLNDITIPFQKINTVQVLGDGNMSSITESIDKFLDPFYEN